MLKSNREKPLMSAMRDLTFLMLVYIKVAGIAAASWQVAFVGKSATFRCNGFNSTGVMWDKRTSASAAPITVSVGDKISPGFNDRFTVETGTADISAGFSQLSITAVERSDAAVYECLHSRTGNLLMRTALAVLDDYPKCRATGSPEGSTDAVDVSCSLCYSGELKPGILCIADSTETSPKQPQQLHTNASCVSFTHSYRPDRRRTNFTITCSFSLTSAGEVHFAHNWTSPPIVVDYGPTVVTIHGTANQTLFRDGDKLLCSALSNQQTQFHWIARRVDHDSNNRTPVMQHGPLFTVKLCEFANNNNNNNNNNEYSNTDAVSAATRLALMCVAVSRNRSAVTSVVVDVRAVPGSFDKCGVHLAHPAALVDGLQVPVPTIVLGVVVVVLIVSLVAQEVRYRRFKSYADRLYVRPTPQGTTSTSISLNRNFRPAVYDELDEGQNAANRPANSDQSTDHVTPATPDLPYCFEEPVVSHPPFAEDRQLPTPPQQQQQQQ